MPDSNKTTQNRNLSQTPTSKKMESKMYHPEIKDGKDENSLPISSDEKNEKIASLINEEENQETSPSSDDKDEKILSASDENDEETLPTSEEKDERIIPSINDVEYKKEDHDDHLKTNSEQDEGGETLLDMKGEKAPAWLDDDDDEKTAILRHKLNKINKVVAKKNDKINEINKINQRLKKINHDFLQNITAQCDKHMKKMKEMTPSKAQGKVKNSPNENKRTCKFFNHPLKCKFGENCHFLHKSQEESANEENIIEENAASNTASKTEISTLTLVSEIKDEHNSESESSLESKFPEDTASS